MIDPPCDTYMIDGIKVTEKDIFRTKVGLFTQYFNKKSPLGEGGVLQAGGQVWLDQKETTEEGGHYVLRCFKPHEDKYATIPESYFWHHLEKVRSTDIDLIDTN